MLRWVCADCPETWLHDETGKGFGQALSHSGLTARTGQKHTIRGLVDTDTGEVLVAGINRRKAVELGYLPPTAKQKAQAAAAARGAEEKASIRRGPADALQASVVNRPKDGTISATVKGAVIEYPAWAPALWSMGMRVFLDPETNDYYPPTAEGMAKYVTDMDRLVHEKLLWIMLGLTREQARTREAQHQMGVILETITGAAPEALVALVRENLAAMTESPAEVG
jgi:hypothetical protein